MPASPKPIRLHLEAQAELQESVDFYRERGGDRLADRFKQHVEAAFKSIQANPERFRPVADLPGVHKVRLKHFRLPCSTSAGLTISGLSLSPTEAGSLAIGRNDCVESRASKGGEAILYGVGFLPARF